MVLVAVAVLASIRAAEAEWRWYAGDPAAPARVLTSVACLAWASSGAVLAWLRPRNAVGWLLLVLGTVTQISIGEHGLARLAQQTDSPTFADRPFALMLSVLVGFVMFTVLGVLPLLYPSGRLRSGFPRAVSVVVVAAAALVQLQVLYADLVPGAWRPFGDGNPPDGSIPWWLLVLGWTPVVVFGLGCLAGWGHTVARLRGAGRSEQRPLILLLVAVVAVLLGATFAGAWVQALVLYLLPVVIAIGILRYRLLGIDTRRADPVAAVSHLGTVLANSDPAQLLDAVTDSLEQSLRPGGLRLTDSAGTLLRARDHDAPDHAAAVAWLTVPLMVGGEPVGTLQLRPYADARDWSRGQHRLIDAMAPQVAVALRALARGTDLQAERDAVVGARRHERDRLRGDLHDGLGPALTGIGLGLQALDDALDRDDHRQAKEITAVLRTETAGTVTEIRRILDALKPATLAAHDLAGALHHAVATVAQGLPVAVRVTELPVLTPAVEESVFRVAMEATTNVVHHADATAATVRLWAEGPALVLEVRDDGSGFAADSSAGVGIRSMHQRAERVGATLTIESSSAGTTVTMTVPDPSSPGVPEPIAPTVDTAPTAVVEPEGAR